MYFSKKEDLPNELVTAFRNYDTNKRGEFLAFGILTSKALGMQRFFTIGENNIVAQNTNVMTQKGFLGQLDGTIIFF